MNQQKNNQQNSKTQQKSKFTIILDLSEPEPVKDIKPIFHDKILDGFFKTIFPTLFEKEAHNDER